MTHRVISATLLLLCAATPALGADLKFILGGDVEYDDNVFREERDEEDDILFRVRPAVRILEDRGQDLNFNVGYAVPFEWALDNNKELRDEDHIADGDFTYRVDDRLQFFGADDFGYLRSTQKNETIGTGGLDGPFATDIGSERERVTRNEGQLGMIYNFSPRTAARVAASSDFFDSTRDDRSRVYSVGAVADVTYRLDLKHQVGGGVGYTFQEFDDRVGFAGSTTDTYRAFLSWRWLIDDTMTFEVQAGPSYLTQDQDSASFQRNAYAVPFTVVSGTVTAFDRTGAPTTVNAGPGSLLVASYLSNPGGGTQVNCDVVDGQVVVQNCSQNIVLNSADPSGIDQSVIDAIVTRVVPISNADPSGDSGSNFTGFGQATLVKYWSQTLSTALSYTRRQGAASGLGSTVVVDAVTLSNTWDFWDRWQLALRGDWINRESVFDSEQTFARAFAVADTDLGLAPGTIGTPLQPIPLAGFCDPATGCTAGSSFNSDTRSDIDTQRWSVAARVTHRLFRNTVLYGQVRYDEQESDSGTLGRTSDFDNLLVTFGVRHTFEPIKLW